MHKKRKRIGRDFTDRRERIERLRGQIRRYREKLSRNVAAKEIADHDVKAYTEKLKASEVGERLHAEAFQLSQAVGKEIQGGVHQSIGGLVTKCLQSIYGDRYKFQIDWVYRKTGTDCRLLLIDTRCQEVLDPLKATGGGVVDVIAIALRATALVLSYPKKRRLLILDEPFKFVSEEYREAIAQLILDLSNELGVQFVIVTHLPQLMIGYTIDLEKIS